MASQLAPERTEDVGTTRVPALFTPLTLRGVTLKNRIVISPMQQYAAGRDGLPLDYHVAHYGRLAMGGAGLVLTEALCTSHQGRLTYSDLGSWDDACIEPLARIVSNVREQGATPGAQILHAGRKASVQRPWDGFEPLSETDLAERNEAPWETIGPSALPANPGWPVPREMSQADIDAALTEHAEAARKCREAGFDVLDIHAAHGYLIHTFLSPISNQRTDKYGGSLENRMRFALKVAQPVRAEWPEDKPLFYRLSCIDDEPGGWTLDESIVLARELGEQGVDVMDCSSRGLGLRGTPVVVPREQGFQVPFAERLKQETDLATMAVGLIMDAEYAEAVVAEGRADLVAIGREALNNPNWPVHAADTLMGDAAYEGVWQPRYGWWLSKRAKSLEAARREQSGK